jgi:hypothetical protein
MTETTEIPAPEVAVLTIAEEPDAWAAAGFAVEDDGTCRLGHVTLELAGRDAGRGVVGWGLRGIPGGADVDVDGFPTRATDRGRAEPAEHPNSAVVVDHVVLLSDDLERTVAAAAHAGLTPRRWRDHVMPDGAEARQVFFRAGQVVLELVGPRTRAAEPRPGVRSFGLAVTALDIERAREVMGGDLGPARPAVQPGRFIATVRRGAFGLITPLALMSPPPPRDQAPPPGRDVRFDPDGPRTVPDLSGRRPAPPKQVSEPAPEDEPAGPFEVP